MIKVCKMKNKYRTYLSGECSIKNNSELKNFCLFFKIIFILCKFLKSSSNKDIHSIHNYLYCIQRLVYFSVPYNIQLSAWYMGISKK